MIRTAHYCDGCGREMIPNHNMICRSQTNEIDLRNWLLCPECALKIDYAAAKFREYWLGGDAT